MKVVERILIFFLLWILGLAAGWGWFLAGVIFLLSLDPARYEYLLLGAIFDATLLFPSGLFLTTVFLLTLGARFLSRYFEAENISSFLVRAAGLAAACCGVLFFYFLAGFGASDWVFAGKFAAEFFLKTAGTAIFLTFLLKIMERAYAPANFNS